MLIDLPTDLDCASIEGLCKLKEKLLLQLEILKIMREIGDIMPKENQ